jgi:MFS family permease
MVPLRAALAVTSINCTRIVAIAGARNVLVAGGVIAAVGFGWLAAMPDHPDYVTHIPGPLLTIGAGPGATVMPSSSAATSGLPPEEAGRAAGRLNMALRIGAAIGLAALVTLASSITQRQLGQHTAIIAQLHGYRAALAATAGVNAIAAIASLFLHPDVG